MSINNETLGQTAEKVICDLNNIDSSHLSKRANVDYEEKLRPVLTRALSELPTVISHQGLETGLRGGSSKSGIDFCLAGKKTLSVKTNKNNNTKVCPSEVGQSSWKVLDKYFKNILEDNGITNLNIPNFKRIVFSSIHRLMPIYINHLMSCDYLLWIFQRKEIFQYLILNNDTFSELNWDIDKFSFTQTIQTWNESCTVKYKNISIGEFQIHNNRSPSKKFRLNLKNLCELVNL